VADNLLNISYLLNIFYATAKYLIVEKVKLNVTCIIKLELCIISMNQIVLVKFLENIKMPKHLRNI